MKVNKSKKVGSFPMAKGSMPVKAGPAAVAPGPRTAAGKGVVAVRNRMPKAK